MGKLELLYRVVVLVCSMYIVWYIFLGSLPDTKVCIVHGLEEELIQESEQYI